MKRRIGIVGGGASGALTALQCWHKFGNESEIIIFDPAHALGRGKAYGTEDTENILNVPAAKMSAYPDRGDDFVEWVVGRHPGIQESEHWPFVPRMYFGQYLEDQLKRIPAESLRHVRSKVSAVVSGFKTYRVELMGGHAYEVDYLVIATGYGHDFEPRYRSSVKRHAGRILQAAAVERRAHDIATGHVLIVGSGLTALDVWKRLRKNPALTFSFLSRRGLFPESHDLAAASTAEIPFLAGMSPLQIVQVLRCMRRSQRISWAVIADQVRAQAQKIWSCWTDKEKSRFVRHVKPYWEVIRHRMPMTVSDAIHRDLGGGRAKALSGRIKEVSETAESLQVNYEPTRGTSLLQLSVDWIVLATGSAIQQGLLSDGSVPGIRSCSHGFGYINDSAPRVWIAGPPSKSAFWEITAVPDIREQAAAIAMAIANDQGRTHAALRVERISTHPDAVGETYFAHLKASSSFGLKMWRLGWYAMLHALLPFLHLDTTSSHLRNLSPVLSRRRQRVSAPRSLKRVA